MFVYMYVFQFFFLNNILQKNNILGSWMMYM